MSRIGLFLTKLALTVIVGSVGLSFRATSAERLITRLPAVVATTNETDSDECRAPVSLVEFEQLALAFHPALVEARARVSALRGKRTQVGLRPNPLIGYQGNEIGDDGRAGMQGAYIRRQFLTGNKRGLNRSVAQQEIEAAQADWAAMRYRVLSDVRIAYYRTLLAQRRVEVSAKLVNIGSESVRTAKARLKAQEDNLVSLLQSETQLQTAMLFQTNAVNDHLYAWRQLALLVGQPQMCISHLSASPEEGLPDLQYECVLEHVLSQSPEIAAAIADVNRARWSVRRELAGRVPNVTAQANVLYNHSNSDTVAGVQIGVPLMIHNRNQGNIQKAQSELRMASAALQRVEWNLRQRFIEVFGRYTNSRLQADRYREEILPNAQRTLELVQKGFRANQLSTLRVLAAQRTYFQSMLGYLDALQRVWEAAIEIDGLLLTNSLQSRRQSPMGSR